MPENVTEIQSTQQKPPKEGVFARLRQKFTDESIDALDDSDHQFFEKLIRRMRPEHRARYEFATEMTKKLIEENRVENPVVVDAASGHGYGAKIIKSEVPGARVVGVDLDFSTLSQKAKKKYGEYGSFTQANVLNLPVETNSVDVVTAFETLEHLDPEKDQLAYLKELRRIIKDSGIIALSIPYPSTTYKMRNKIWHGWGSGSHIYEPSREEAKILLEQAGFTLVGEYGQAITDSRKAKAMSFINRIIPIWGIYSWLPKRDRSVQPVPNLPHTTSLVHVFIAKPAIEEKQVEISTTQTPLP